MVIEVAVVAPAFGTPGKSAQFVLQQDRWDDFGYKTQYHLYFFDEDEAAFIGNVKILRKGQTTSSTSVLSPGLLDPLDENFCSVGQSLDYYERIAELPQALRSELLYFLRDAVVAPERANEFKDEDGWQTSVLRDVDLESFSQLARTLLDRDYNALPSVGLDLAFEVAGWQAPLRLSFPAPRIEPFGMIGMSGHTTRLPQRVAVLTGRNGSGKSTLLARLARVLHASQANRRRGEIAALGTITPPGIGFSRIITIAYSAFDTFQVPGVDEAERRQIISDVRAGTGRYVFAGLRDIARELEDRLEQDTTSGQGLAPAAVVDRQARTYLKPAEQLADEYASMIESISTQGRTSLLHRAVRLLLADPSFSDIPDQAPSALFAMDARSTFMGWSTGHKIVMHAIVTLIAHAQPKTIVLLDEPECHLHPPLLAALMHAIRSILEEYDAFAVIATHSPVVAQETLGRHVSVINRVGDEVTILAPRIETYGESIGEITDEVFGLHPGATDYHDALRAMVDRGLSLEQIAENFDRGLSVQARAYVMSILAGKAAV